MQAKIEKIISGGPMMGFPLYELHIPCTKTTSAFLFLEHDAVAEAQKIQIPNSVVGSSASTTSCMIRPVVILSLT